MKHVYTTIAGVLLIMGSIAAVAFEAFSPKAVPQEHIAALLAALVTGAGFIAAADGKGAE